MYACFFTAKPRKGHEYSTLEKNGSCFAVLFAGITSYTHVKIYVLKDYKGTKYSASNNINISKSEIYDYIVALKQCGFSFSVAEKTVKLENVERECYEFSIELKRNTSLSNLVLILAIRYIYESNFDECIKMFLKYCKKREGTHFINRFLFSNECIANNGHTISRNGKFKFLNDEEIKKVFFNEFGCKGTKAIPKFKPTQEDKVEYDRLVKEEPSNDILIKIKEISDKYSAEKT